MGGIMKKILLIVLALTIISCGQKKSAQDYFNKGAQLIEKGEIDKSIENYQQGLKLEPRSAIGNNLLGMAYRSKFNQTGDPEWKKKEIASFEAALEINPDYMNALVNLGATYYYSGEKKKAVPYFKHALEVYPEHPEAEQIKKMIADVEE
ncbi:tetratricopeptide repeat protein [candidate division WOR-3 bacterium]|nr:tetratricopeptide repeat protein [candidate division WOR-3 bacterium]